MSSVGSLAHLRLLGLHYRVSRHVLPAVSSGHVNSHMCPQPAGHQTCFENHSCMWVRWPPWPHPWHQTWGPFTIKWLRKKEKKGHFTWFDMRFLYVMRTAAWNSTTWKKTRLKQFAGHTCDINDFFWPTHVVCTLLQFFLGIPFVVSFSIFADFIKLLNKKFKLPQRTWRHQTPTSFTIPAGLGQWFGTPPTHRVHSCRGLKIIKHQKDQSSLKSFSFLV